MSLLPRQDRRYLDGRGITVREVIDGGKKGVILTGITLPEGKYQVAQADILILLPPSYPEVAPDMFYAVPHLKLLVGQREPRCTQVRELMLARPGSAGLATTTSGVPAPTASGPC